MIDTARQVPAIPAWAIDLRDARGPLYVVLRRTESAALTALAEHLLEIGAIAAIEDAGELVGDAHAEHAVVIW